MAAFGRLPGCFLSALPLSLTHTGLTVAAGGFGGLASEFILFMRTFTSAPEPALDALSVRRHNGPPRLQCFGVPGDDPYSLNS